jgi:Arc/MetJ-type ribon-helix-helix transcriptional regulator
MKVIQVELPEKLAQELEAFVKEGWFRDEGEAIRYALTQFLNRYRLQLTEHFQREDIAWALKWKEAK